MRNSNKFLLIYSISVIRHLVLFFIVAKATDEVACGDSRKHYGTLRQNNNDEHKSNHEKMSVKGGCYFYFTARIHTTAIKNNIFGTSIEVIQYKYTRSVSSK